MGVFGPVFNLLNFFFEGIPQFSLLIRELIHLTYPLNDAMQLIQMREVKWVKQ